MILYVDFGENWEENKGAAIPIGSCSGLFSRTVTVRSRVVSRVIVMDCSRLEDFLVFHDDDITTMLVDSNKLTIRQNGQIEHRYVTPSDESRLMWMRLQSTECHFRKA